MKRRTTIFLLFGVLVVIALVYSPIVNGFFQQDEWASFSQYFVNKTLPFKKLLFFLFTPSVMHFSPLTVLSNFVSFYFFGFNYQAYALFSLFSHLTASYLVFCLSKILFKNLKLALFCALVFGVSVTGHQATAWVATNLPTQWAAIFAILAIIKFFNCLQTQNVRDLYFSFLFIFISLLFKETTIGLFLLFPIALMLLEKAGSHKRIYFKIMILATLLYVALRGSMFLLPRQVGTSTVFESQSVPKLVYNFATVPIKAISQSILPGNIIRAIAETAVPIFHPEIAGQKGSSKYEIFLMEQGMEAVSLLFSLMILFLSIYVFFKNKNNYLSKIMIFSLAWIVINSFIFAFAPEKSGVMSIIDSRYLYFVSIGTAFFVVSFISLLLKKERCVFIVLVLFVIFNVFWLERQLTVYVKEGTVRKKILEVIKKNYPLLPAKVIFYTESDISYYGLPSYERILPFQSGLGQTLLVWYYPTEHFSQEFFKNQFLWGITDQGYKEKDGRGFGYFRDFDKLIEKVKDEKLPPESVVSFRYDSKSQILTDNTAEVRGRIKGYFSVKQKIDPSEIGLFASTNPKETGLMLDGKRNTFWDSKLPYALPQFIQIRLDNLEKISLINIDSSNNKDQNEVGYAVYLSNDGQVWEQFFYAKKYPSKENGLVDIYLLPKYARFVKIQQIGYHQYASWVIHELKIYADKN